jgi:hypothetical protein
MEDKLVVTGVPNNRDEAVAIAYDLMLKHIFGEQYEYLQDHKDATSKITEDKEWYESFKTKNELYINSRVEKQAKTLEDMEEGDRAVELAKYRATLEPKSDLVSFEDLEEAVSNCYWTPLKSTCQMNNITMQAKYTKTENGTETELESVGNERSNPNLEISEKITYKARVDLSKDGMEPMAYEAEHGNMASAQSAVAFNCLEQLLNDKIVKTIVWTYRQMQNKTQKKKNFEHTKKHPNKFPAGSKPMMMPVMMGPNGQMMIMATPEMMKNAAMQGNMNRKTNKNKQTNVFESGIAVVKSTMRKIDVVIARITVKIAGTYNAYFPRSVDFFFQQQLEIK